MKQLCCQNCNLTLAKSYDDKIAIPADIIHHVGEITEIDNDNSKIDIKCPRCQTMNEIEYRH